MDLEAFCDEHGLDVPDDPIKFEMRPASPGEAGLFYALPPEKDEELGQVVEQMRRGVLKDFSSMLRHCHISGGKISGGICCQNYGFVMKTKPYRYCLRCNPVRGDYQAYLTAYDLRVQELSQTQEQGPELDSGPVMGGIG